MFAIALSLASALVPPDAGEHGSLPASGGARVIHGHSALQRPASSAPRSAGRGAAAGVDAANRASLQEPRSEGFVESVQVYPWSEGGVYRVYTAPGHVTDIALQPGETLTAVAAGDTARWVLGETTSGSGPSRQVHILLKPSAAGLSTNLVITTDRRIYRLAAEATRRTAMAAVSWTYPGDALLALATGSPGGQAPLDVALDSVAPFDFGYVLKGDNPSWRPLRVFNDGRQVFIEFPPGFIRDQAPPLFAVGPTGESELLNYRVRDRFYVVDRLFGAAELRLGGKKQTVVRIERQEGKRR